MIFRNEHSNVSGKVEMIVGAVSQVLLKVSVTNPFNI